MVEVLARIKRILDIVDDTKDGILNDFIDMYSKAINLKCGTTDFPIELDFILVEAVVARYRKVGSEGISTEKIDVYWATYNDEILNSYQTYFQDYKSKNNTSSGLTRVKFL